MSAASDKDQQPQGANKRRLVVSLLALPVYFALFMFLPAGTWAWAKGWLFIGVFLGTLAVVALYLWRVNPEVWGCQDSLSRGHQTLGQNPGADPVSIGVCHHSRCGA
jgi:hypothetical protein